MHNVTEKSERLARRKKDKIKDVLLVCVLAGLMVFAVWRIFYNGAQKAAVTEPAQSEKEQMLEQLLSQIAGAGDVEVMICEDEDGVKGVVIVCDGANDLRVNAALCEATATALGTDENNIKIYQKKNK